MKNKPEVVTKVSKTRTVKLTLERYDVETIVMSYVRRNFGNFRGFADQEFEFDFLEDGHILITAHKETTT